MPNRLPRPTASFLTMAFATAVAALLALGLIAIDGIGGAPVPGAGEWIHPVPLASSWGLLALLLLIIGGGFWMARRAPQD